MKSKKFTLLFILACLTIFLNIFSACTKEIDIYDEAVCYLNIKYQDHFLSNSRTVLPEDVSREEFIYELWGRYEGGENKKIISWISYSKMNKNQEINMNTGKWDLTLKVFFNNTEILEGNTSCIVHNGENSIEFNLEEIPGTGYIDINFMLPFNPNGVIKVELYKFNEQDEYSLNSFYSDTDTLEGKEITENNIKYLVYTYSKSVANDFYILKLKRVHANVETCFYTTGITVSNNRTSTKNIILEDEWDDTFSLKSYAITYELDGGENDSSNPTEIKVENNSLILEKPVKEGYIFEGWYTEKEYVNEIKAIDCSTLNEDIVLYAKWKNEFFTITYKVDGGENDFENPTKVLYGDNSIILKKPIKTSYIFEGWYTEKEYINEIVEINWSTLGEDVVLYAKWKNDFFNITYELGGGKNDSENPTKVLYGDISITLKKPVKEGYIFEGWYTEKEYINEIEEMNWSTLDEDIVLYAKWDDIMSSFVDINDIKVLKTEVTQKLYTRIMGENPSYFMGDDNPVENISWYDAIYFCNKFSEMVGFEPVYSISVYSKETTDVTEWNYTPHKGDKISGNITQNTLANGFRLPTEEEWEFAAKGGENYKYSGSDNLDEVGWYYSNSENKTHPVAQKKANGYGLYDMSGNVWEWCWNSNLLKYHRGGGYDMTDDYCKVSYRFSGSYRSDLGFRIVCSTSN